MHLSIETPTLTRDRVEICLEGVPNARKPSPPLGTFGTFSKITFWGELEAKSCETPTLMGPKQMLQIAINSPHFPGTGWERGVGGLNG